MKESPFVLIKQTFSDWIEDKAPRLGAAFAFYAIFSIPPTYLDESVARTTRSFSGGALQ